MGGDQGFIGTDCDEVAAASHSLLEILPETDCYGSHASPGQKDQRSDDACVLGVGLGGGRARRTRGFYLRQASAENSLCKVILEGGTSVECFCYHNSFRSLALNRKQRHLCNL